MGRRRSAIIATVATTILCGLPGLASLCIGPLAIWGSQLPTTDIPPGDVNSVIGIGVVVICLGLLGVSIPVLMGLFTLRKSKFKPEDFTEPIPLDDF
jgi:hypothetical protein